jgi:hypothetical protein
MQDGERGPLTTLEGERVRILRTSLTPEPDGPVGSSSALACADGPLWVLESESV